MKNDQPIETGTPGTREQFLITAHPRSGTQYMVKVLQDLGHKVPGERINYDKDDGCVSWPHLVVANKFDVVLHQVRHPLDVISSTLTLHDYALEYLAFHVGTHDENPIVQAAHTWIKWNEYIERITDFWYRIEDFYFQYPGVFKYMGLEIPEELPEIPKDQNTRKHLESYRKIDWYTLEMLDFNIYREVRDLAQRYGYD